MNSTIIDAITGDKFTGAIFSTIIVILIGYFVRKRNIVSDKAAKTLSSLLLSVALPALAFKAFMTDIDDNTVTTGLNVLIFGFVAYILLIILAKIFYLKYAKDKDLHTSLVILTAFGSTTFFATPIVASLYGDQGVIYANIFNIAYRVFLYSYAFIAMSGLKVSGKNIGQIFINPIIIATIVGLLIWIFQKELPQFTVTDGDKVTSYAYLRIDKSLPWLFSAINYLANLSSPLAWLAIGMTLASIPLSEAIKEKVTIIYAIVKLIILPVIFLVLLVILNAVGISFSYEAICAIILMLSTPPATVAVAYAIRFEKKPVLASNISLVNTVLAVIAIIIWIIVLTVLHGASAI